jgi:hypothetical protein
VAQEGARKDIARAFGVLQCKFKVMCTPILSLHMGGATNLTACCIILHSMMGVSDRIMGDVQHARYDPSKVVDNCSGGVSSHTTGDAVHVSDHHLPPLVGGMDTSTTVTAPGFSSRDTNEHREQLLQNFAKGDFAATMGVMRLLEEKELVVEGEWRPLHMALLNDKGRDHRA